MKHACQSRCDLRYGLFVMAVLIAVYACARTLPESVDLPSPDPGSPVWIDGLPSSEICPRVFNHDDTTPEEVDRMMHWMRVFERRDVLQHAKTAVIDGIWSLVGSTNLDHRSFLHANEANLVIWSENFAGQMERQFLSDQEKNHELTLSEWRDRAWHRRLLEAFAAMFDYWL